MKFKTLQDNLRRILWRQIANGELTGVRLAEEAGFQQAHISNFLNRKRGLSLEGMDKVLSVTRLSVLDLLDAGEVNRRANISQSGDDEFEDVGWVDSENAARPSILKMHLMGIYKFKKNFSAQTARGSRG